MSFSTPSPEGTPVPPPVAAGVRPGELTDRFLARLIDGLILGAVFGVLYAVLGAILISSVHYDLDKGEFVGGSTVLFYIALGVIDLVISMAYYVYLESSRGQTIGKMAMKLKTVGPDGVSTPTVEQAVRRNIFNAWPALYIIPVAGVFLAPIAAVAAFVGEILIAVGINNDTVGRQAWHDHFAGGTRVLKVG